MKAGLKIKAFGSSPRGKYCIPETGTCNVFVQCFCGKSVSSVVLDKQRSIWVDMPFKHGTVAEYCLRNLENVTVVLGQIQEHWAES